jgi:hypothetical protein
MYGASAHYICRYHNLQPNKIFHVEVPFTLKLVDPCKSFSTLRLEMETFQLLSRGGAFNKQRFKKDVHLFNVCVQHPPLRSLSYLALSLGIEIEN